MLEWPRTGDRAAAIHEAVRHPDRSCWSRGDGGPTRVPPEVVSTPTVTAFVLAGGGSLGAIQVAMLRPLKRGVMRALRRSSVGATTPPISPGLRPVPEGGFSGPPLDGRSSCRFAMGTRWTAWVIRSGDTGCSMPRWPCSRQAPSEIESQPHSRSESHRGRTWSGARAEIVFLRPVAGACSRLDPRQASRPRLIHTPAAAAPAPIRSARPRCSVSQSCGLGRRARASNRPCVP